MTKLFISHSSKDNDSAIALKVWLEQNGWIGEGDIYLDVDPEDGIAASERWLAAFNAANTRCEAVLFLVSRAWLDSKWCLDEYQVANNMNKKLVPLLLENVTHSELPTGLTVQWQVVALWDQGGQTVPLVAKDKHTDKATVVHFSEAGLTALKRGLEKAGLTPESFDLCRDAAAPLGWRAPYRGLEALEEKDAAVFFGRDADIVRTIDTLRGLRSRSGPRMVVILGASGAGKSSFLRAGLLPRLKRDDACWLPLQPIRAAQGGAIEGREGLLAALEEVYLRIEERRSRADLRDQLKSEATFIGLVNDVRRIGAERANVEAPPLVILSIDQAEELFATDTVGTGAERDAVHLLAFARAGIEAGALLVLATIRSDSWEKLQNARTLTGVYKELLSLEAVPQGEIARIIREPALKLRAKVGLDAPVFAEDVVVELQKEVDRQEDALPLLAFALERLMREHSAARTIDMQFLRNTGGVTSAIEAAAEKAMQDAGLSHDASERREALRLAFVPHLVGIDPESKTVRRNVVLLRDIPQASGPLIETLTDRRLLVTKGEGDRTTIEVAHEALLRSWSSLATILADDAIDLVTLNKALSAAKDWEQLKDTQRRTELLFHSGFLLDDAQKLAAKGDAWAHMDSASTILLEGVC